MGGMLGMCRRGTSPNLAVSPEAAVPRSPPQANARSADSTLHRTEPVLYGVPVIQHELVGSARVPGHLAELRCFRHDGDFTIWIDGTELMSSRVHGSEEALAEL